MIFRINVGVTYVIIVWLNGFGSTAYMTSHDLHILYGSYSGLFLPETLPKKFQREKTYGRHSLDNVFVSS